MNNRIKQIRQSIGMTQKDFADNLGLTRNYIAQVEMGVKSFSDRTIRDVCQHFGIREEWLREGTEPMYVSTGREEEMARLVKRLMSDSPDSFQSALITTLLRFDPDGPEWEILERIYNSIAAEMGHGKDGSE